MIAVLVEEVVLMAVIVVEVVLMAVFVIVVLLVLPPMLGPSMLDSILLQACVSMANGLTLESNSWRENVESR